MFFLLLCGSCNCCIMVLVLYYSHVGSACRTVLLTGKALGLEFELKLIDLKKGEHQTPEFIKINPQHAVPTLVDEEFTLGESRAISAYLVNKYGENDTLYPKDPRSKAVVDRLLYFDMGTLNYSFTQAFIPICTEGKAAMDEEHEKKLKESLDMLEIFAASDGRYLTGDNVTIADFSIAATVSSVEAVKFDISPWTAVSSWLSSMKELPYYQEANGAGIDALKELLAGLKEKKEEK